MKFNCGPTYREIIEAKEKWHLWFAWHPVRLASQDCRWLEKVWRKGEHRSSMADCYWYWEYQAYGLNLIFPENKETT